MNPLLEDWSATPFGMPPFERIEEAHFKPAFEAALSELRANVEAIATDAAAPTFANTIEALERSDRLLDRVASVFFNLSSSCSTDGLQAIEEDIAPELAKTSTDVYTDQRLFARVDALSNDGLSDEQARVLKLYKESFVRAGAQLDEAGRTRMSAVMQRLATLGAQFSKNLLADEKAFELVLGSEEDLAGLSDAEISAMARAAKDRGHDGKWVVTASRSAVEPFLQSSKRRDLREAVWRGFVGRGADRAETSTKEIAAETVRLRDERAKLLGFENFASFKLENQMAKTPDAVRGLLERVWGPAKAAAEADRAKLQALIAEEGGNFEVAPWDWAYYAEILRQREHDLDDAELKPYMQLENIIAASFDTASRLFGLSFEEREDLPRHHPDVRVWDVTRGDTHVGIFMGDYFTRPSKRSGAWMSTFRDQETMDGVVRPIVINTCNFVQAKEGEPVLLTFDGARTLFHEFGHALHGLMSDVTYPRISGTSVARDFVELPSQLYEHWLMRPEVLGKYALHAETGEPMPQALLDRVIAAQNFDMGAATVEYLSSALVDIAMHTAEVDETYDPMAFEASVLEEIGMPDGLGMRHRTPQFAHVFSGDGYSSGYYSYMWSEVMDADAFGAFEDAGDVFDAATAERLSTSIYSAGGRQDPELAYLAFRGRAPEVEALLKRRGLLDAA
jgi:peptidyl-dipeptidase Dcp